VIIIAVAAVLMGRWLHRESRKSWARETAIPEIERLLNADDFHGAFDLARQARRYLPADPMLDAAWERIANTITFQTDPPGATVSYREFTDLDGPWVVLGETPLEAMPFPRGAYRWRIEKEGYEVFETKKSFFYSNDRGPLDAVVEPEGESPIAGREQWVTIDYLEERPDIDQTRVAYTGLSMGAGAIGRAALAYEDRFRAAMLWSGGFGRGGADYVEDAVGTVKRITVPTLMINGRYDYDLPVDTLQRPFFDLLATPDEYKRHMVFDSGHWPFPRGEFIRENLAWLDRYLGPVNE
jgi:pimeloyl-ACP methyl ester carboxylesterase